MPARKSSSMAAAAAAKSVLPARPPSHVSPDTEVGAAAVSHQEERVKFTALLDSDTTARFDRIVEGLRRFGRRNGRFAGKADVLRALVRMVDDDPDLAARMTAYLFPEE